MQSISSQWKGSRWMVAAVAVVFVGSALVAGAYAQMKKPQMVTLSGKVIDLTCAAKGKIMTDSWANAENNDHMTPDGKKPNCAKMCLMGGQPAALYDTEKERISAVFACNPRSTLVDYAAMDVDVQGFWAGGKSDAAKTFVPQKIRKAGAERWVNVDCATMHG